MFPVLGRRCYRPEFPSWRSPGLIYEELVGDKGVGCEGNGSLRSEPLFTQQRLACVAAADLHTCSAYRRLVSRIEERHHHLGFLRWWWGGGRGELAGERPRLESEGKGGRRGRLNARGGRYPPSPKENRESLKALDETNKM